MKRSLKKFFSRFTFVALTIILIFVVNVIVLLGAFALLEEFVTEQFSSVAKWIRLVVEILRWIILIGTAIHIVNRDMIPEAKLPWLLCIVALNIFGVAIYAVFSYNRPSFRARKYFHAMHGKFDRYSERAVPEETLKKEQGHWADVSEALYRKNPVAVAHTGTKTEYFPSGERFLKRLLEDLECAKEYVFMEYFVVAKGIAWNAVLEVLARKVKEGVEVRLLYDDIGCMGRIHVRYYKKLCKMGIKCVKFNPFVPVVTNVHNNRDHRKITVIDGKIAYTGGINLADEYFNLEQPYGHWKDTAVRLEGEGVKNFIIMFLRTYNMQRRTAEDFTPYIPHTYPFFEGEGYVQPYDDGPRPLYNCQLAEEVYLDILAGARKYVWITTPYLIIDHRLKSTLIATAARGVDVRIVTPHIPDKKSAFAITRSNYMALIKGGVKIYEYAPGFIHSKTFLADDTVGVVGTVNLDYRSLMHHFEDAVLLYGTRALVQLKEDFEDTFAVSLEQTEADAKRNVLSRGLSEIAKAFAPLF